MAKGSGGVGKSKGKASVSGVAKKKAAGPMFRPIDISATTLKMAANALPAADTFHGRPYLAPLLAQFGTTPKAAEERLLSLHQRGDITLSRADLVEAMAVNKVHASEIRHSTGARFHLIEFN